MYSHEREGGRGRERREGREERGEGEERESEEVRWCDWSGESSGAVTVLVMVCYTVLAFSTQVE